MNGVSVKATAFSRNNSSGAWATAYLGLYGPGLGVTDGSESGSSSTHKVDNQGSRNNYVLFEFSSPVLIDQVFLDSIEGDSDISVWIGTKTDPFNNHITLSDAVLTSLGAREDNNTTSSASSRWADINPAGSQPTCSSSRPRHPIPRPMTSLSSPSWHSNASELNEAGWSCDRRVRHDQKRRGFRHECRARAFSHVEL